MARKLAVRLTAITAPFKSAMGKASKSLKGFQDRAKTAAGSVKVLGGTLLAVATTGAIARGLNRSLQSIDQIAKQSAKIGATTRELTGLQHAAELTGAGAQTASTGLQPDRLLTITFICDFFDSCTFVFIV